MRNIVLAIALLCSYTAVAQDVPQHFHWGTVVSWEFITYTVFNVPAVCNDTGLLVGGLHEIVVRSGLQYRLYGKGNEYLISKDDDRYESEADGYAAGTKLFDKACSK